MTYDAYNSDSMSRVNDEAPRLFTLQFVCSCSRTQR